MQSSIGCIPKIIPFLKGRVAEVATGTMNHTVDPNNHSTPLGILHVGVSENGGSEYGILNSRTLIIRTPK